MLLKCHRNKIENFIEIFRFFLYCKGNTKAIYVLLDFESLYHSSYFLLLLFAPITKTLFSFITNNNYKVIAYISLQRHLFELIFTTWTAYEESSRWRQNTDPSLFNRMTFLVTSAADLMTYINNIVFIYNSLDDFKPHKRA